MSIQGKPDNLSGTHIHLHAFLNSFHKYIDIYDGTGLLVVKWLVVLDRGDLLHIHLNIHLCIHLFQSCVHKYTGIYDGIDFLAPNGVLVLEMGVLLHIHLLLNCVHIYTPITG